jgi:hypothetical protein
MPVPTDIPKLNAPLPDKSDLPMDIHDLDTPLPDKSDLPTDICDLNIPWLDTSESVPSPVHPSSQIPTGSAGTGDDQDPLPEPQDIISTIDLPQLWTAQQYIDLLRSTELVNSGMQPKEINDLHNPVQDHTLVDPSLLLCSL